MTTDLIDVLIRTKNSEEFLDECLKSVHEEIPLRRIMIVDGGSTDRTLEIASSFDKVDVYVRPDSNLGQITKFGLSKSQTEWVAVIDSDIILQKGWFDNIKEHMKQSDAVEGCRIEHYRFTMRVECKKLRYGVFGQTLVRTEPILDMDLDLTHGEDAAIKYKLEQKQMKWEKVDNYLADHYPKTVEGSTYRRTGAVFRPYAIHVPKKQQIEEGRIYREYCMITKK